MTAGPADAPRLRQPAMLASRVEEEVNSFTVDVTAPPGSTRYILCVIHPWMQAKLEVE